jgi:arylsulfatase A-like enzyme
MLTSLHPWQHGIHRNGLILDQKHDTVAERLRAAGFHTAAVIASYPLSKDFGFDQGFDSYRQDFESGTVTSDWLGAKSGEVSPGSAFYSRADRVVEKMWLEMEKAPEGKPQFLWTHFFDPHDPYGESTGENLIGPMSALQVAKKGGDPMPLVKRARRLYDADVRFLDSALAKLLERIEAETDDYETHVLIASDHGESFGEDGSMGHGSRLTSGQIHVPCLLKSQSLEPGVRSDIAGSIDIGRTIMSLAGLEVVSPHGRNLADPAGTRSQAFGMRRMYGAKATFPRLDGKAHPVAGELYYAVFRDGFINRGNRDQTLAPISDLIRADQLTGLFDTFSSEMSGIQPDEIQNSEARAKLRALGYLQ